MLDCLVLGDSIAVGVGQARPSCLVSARVGVSSAAYVRTLFASAPKAAQLAVISLGVNDDPAAHTLDALRSLRGELQVRAAVWLLPGLKDAVRAAIRTVAAEHGDRVVDTRPEVGADHLHPTGAGYRRIAAEAVGEDRRDAGGVREAAVRGVSHLPAVFRPVLPVNAPQWLPMVQVPSVHASLQQGTVFRLWMPPAGRWR